MVLANPIYYEVFDHLLEDERAVQFFISTLIVGSNCLKANI